MTTTSPSVTQRLTHSRPIFAFASLLLPLAHAPPPAMRPLPGYVLDFYGGSLPSFAALPAAQQRSVRFTQSKMGFNHGWLVQAEAPPGALFSKFKECIETDDVHAEDIAFYFVHWLTDLAGAEATPLHGAEKFVVKFPHSVLASFIRSFSIVQRLAHTTESELAGQFLSQWWPSAALGPAPRGPDAVALMRLVVQAQNPAEQRAVYDAFGSLERSSRETLACELALTGVAGQTYALSEWRGGPAFLVYYSPAFVRKGALEDAGAALYALAEVYRAARALWPTDEAMSGRCVTVHIGQIKDKGPRELADVYAEGQCWVLERKGAHDAVAELRSLLDVPALLASGAAVLLPLWARAAAERTGSAAAGGAAV